MAALSSAIDQCDSLIASLEAVIPYDAPDRPTLTVDPDDPWAAADRIQGVAVSKHRCETTGYLMTLPFETECPMPEAFVGDDKFLDGLLKPVRMLDVRKEPGSCKSPSKKTQESVGKQANGSAQDASIVENFCKCLLRVGFVKEVERVEGSDKLYCCQVDIGEGSSGTEQSTQRQVVTGLQKFVKIEELKEQMVVLIVNLKVCSSLLIRYLSGEHITACREYHS